MGGRGAIIVAGTIRIPPNTIDEIAPHIEAYVHECRREDGCIQFSFSRDISDPGLIRIFEIWRDTPALERHFQTAHVAAWRALWRRFGVHDRSLMSYEVEESKPT
jgi:quinol monooxygenase YgiN